MKPRAGWIAVAMVLVATAAILLAMGRSPLCPCGHVALWAGQVQSAENSQQLSDWYSFSHVIHGFLFYAATRWLLSHRPASWRLAAATLVECGWEILENSPLIIDRYRAVTMAFGYSGDSVVNSLSDLACMILGFAIARRLPVAATVALAVGMEALTAWTIRDGLILNVWMLVAPNAAVRAWQLGA